VQAADGPHPRVHRQQSDARREGQPGEDGSLEPKVVGESIGQPHDSHGQGCWAHRTRTPEAQADGHHGDGRRLTRLDQTGRERLVGTAEAVTGSVGQVVYRADRELQAEHAEGQPGRHPSIRPRDQGDGAHSHSVEGGRERMDQAADADQADDGAPPP
jgi:hypothetical protein